MRIEEESTSNESAGAASAKIKTFSSVEFKLNHSHPEQEKQIDQLKEIVNRLSNEVNDLRDAFEASPVRIRVIETKDISINEAKTMILKYMKDHDVTYPDDIADELRLDLKLTIEAINQLIKEGKIVETKK